MNYLYKKNSFFSAITTASLWILIDYIFSITPVLIPWVYAGYTQVFSRFIQISDVAGIFGVSFLVILINAVTADMLINKKKYLKYYIAILIIIFISVFSYGTLRIQKIKNITEDCNSPELSATVIQGNFSSKEKWTSANSSAVISTYVSMTKQVIDDADIIVWPETVLNSTDAGNLEVVSGISALLKEKQIFISGAVRNDAENTVYNSIFTADKNGLRHIYDKKILFPFTETSLAGMSSGNFHDSPAIFNQGKTKPVYTSPGAVIGFSICLESIYPEYIRKIKNSGAEIMVNTANDSWFGSTYEPEMHLRINIARAVENRFHIIRSSNSGISAVISPSGEIINSIGLNRRDKISANIKPVKIDSFYSRTGDWIAALSLIIITAALVLQLKEN
jgi:apolipoprotein N-acyltransferase